MIVHTTSLAEVCTLLQTKPHQTHQHQHPRPIPDRLDPHSADSSPSPRLGPGPDLQVGHYNNHLHQRHNIINQQYITTSYLK